MTQDGGRAVGSSRTGPEIEGQGTYNDTSVQESPQ